MNKRALGLVLMMMGACAYGTGCGSSSNNNGGTGGATGTDGGGTGGKTDGGGTGGAPATDGGNDVPVSGDASDGGGAATFTQVFAILSNVATPTTDTAPGCAHCHDGLVPGSDAGATTLPHSMNFTDKMTAYNQLVGVDSLRCTADGGTDGGQLKRILAGNPALSVLVQKVRQGLGMGTACDGVQMPLNPVRPITDASPPDGSPPDAAFDAGTFMTHYMVSPAQLQTIESWVNAGAPNN
jgi:hypothetical protein